MGWGREGNVLCLQLVQNEILSVYGVVFLSLVWFLHGKNLPG